MVTYILKLSNMYLKGQNTTLPHVLKYYTDVYKKCHTQTVVTLNIYKKKQAVLHFHLTIMAALQLPLLHKG